jgi:hypothetical protein
LALRKYKSLSGKKKKKLRNLMGKEREKEEIKEEKN